ncbi:MAG TPA: hypothetical protein VD866_10000 [Urbifossiella sp.]|nr:hypothetical protein [Urbifossiella sp.]
MRKLPSSPEFLAALAGGGYPAEVCNDAGERVAVVLPPDLFREMFDIYCDKVFGPPGPRATPADIAAAVSTEELIAYGRALDAMIRGKGAA